MNIWAGATHSFSVRVGVYHAQANANTNTGTFALNLAEHQLRRKAYLNWLIFDRSYTFKDGGYVRLSSAPKENGQNVAHEKLSSQIVAKEPGYIYVYLSNEEGTPLEVYFDDFKVDQVKSPVVQMDDYYPFGLAFNSYQRENTVPNKLKFGGKEEQTDLALNTIDWGWRQYDPAIGRWNVIDQWAEKYHTTSPYAFVQNNPILNREIDGRYFSEKNEKKAAKNERKADKRADKLEAKATKREARGKDSGDLRARVAELRQSSQDIKDMRSNTTTEFRYGAVGGEQYKQLGLSGPSTTLTGQNSKGDNVVTMFTESNMGNKLHESRHGGQIARNEYNVATNAGYGVADEISANRAQYSWSGRLEYRDNPSNEVMMQRLKAHQDPTTGIITNINQINANVINSMVDPGFRPIYPPADGNGNLIIPLDVWNRN